ncbi:MAG: hypothetical protein E6L04_08805 [Thaumarchaeota archaeon]|nr:MAG: hypothetical protein E6L04_08805 [Nitrososphaerota archaeon]TLX90208.1 MAG: hypothetical protein E6K97_04045 [Nitrososphaerota archaeon]
MSSISFVTRTAFSNPFYLIIASIAGFVFWIVTNTFDNILFFSPFLVFYVPNDMLGVFFLSCINSILVAVLVNFNLHIIRDLKLRISKSAVAGTTISVISSACASCSTFGFILASTFGGLAVVVSNFLSGNQLIIREISTLILLIAVSTCYIKIRESCKSPYRYQIHDK